MTDSKAKYASPGALALPPFGIRKINEAAVELERQGREIIHLELGRPDFDTPGHIKAAAIDALQRGRVHYTSNWGLDELRRAVAAKFARELGVEYDPDGEVLITVGAAEAALISFAAFLGPGDEVLIPEPGYTAYVNLPGFLGARAVSVPCPREHAFEPDLEALRRAVTPATKMVFVNSPNNPTGAVWSRETLAGIARICQEFDLLVVADEVYEKLTFAGAEHVSIASLPGMRERTVLINALSKTYSATGWRVGYMAAPGHLMEHIYRIHQHNTACANTFAQWGAVAALDGPQEEVAAMVAAFDKRRRYLYTAISQIPGVNCLEPRGAFYVFPDVSAFGLKAEEMALYLLREAGVALVHGTAFGKAGEGHLRISYASSLESLQEAVGRIGEALSRLEGFAC